jgi:membrane protease YdiL (CAAX protease family)
MRNMQPSNDQLMEVILVMKTTPDIIINIVMMAILPAIGEELIFRGVIQKQLVKWLSNPHVAIFITSVFFSAFHMQFLGFLSRLILGMVFGYLFYYSKSIRLPILAHFANNFLALMLAFYFGTDTSDQAFEDPYSIPIVAFSIIGILGSIYLIWVNKNKLSNTVE